MPPRVTARDAERRGRVFLERLYSCWVTQVEGVSWFWGCRKEPVRADGLHSLLSLTQIPHVSFLPSFHLLPLSSLMCEAAVQLPPKNVTMATLIHRCTSDTCRDIYTNSSLFLIIMISTVWNHTKEEKYHKTTQKEIIITLKIKCTFKIYWYNMLRH